MKTLRPSLAILIGLAGTLLFGAEATAPATGKAPVALPLSPRFKQVRDRIDALFQLRNEPPAPPDPRANPFRPSGPAALAPVTPASSSSPEVSVALPPPQAAGDMALLQQAVATLKITGVVARGVEAHVQINAKLYKKSDVVQASVQGQVVYIRVREITGRTATLALNEAELTLKF